MLSCECFPLFELGDERLYGFFLLPSGYIRGGKFKVFARRARTSKLPPLSSCSGGMMLLSTKHDPWRLSLLQPLRSCRFFRAQWSLRRQPAGSYIRCCSRIGSGPNRGHGQPFRVCRHRHRVGWIMHSLVPLHTCPSFITTSIISTLHIHGLFCALYYTT